MNTWVYWGKVMDLIQRALDPTASLLTNSFQWVWAAVSIVLILVVCVFVGLIVLRKKGPHSEKKDRTQAQINKKMYPGGKVVTDTVPAGENGKKSLLDRTRELGLSAQVFWNLIAVIAGIALWYAIPNTEIRPKDVGVWGQKYWLQLLIVWFVGAALVWLNVKEKGSSETLQKALAGTAIILLVVLPFWSWVSSSASKTPLEMTLSAPANSDSPHIKTKPGHATKFTGSGFTIHCGYRDKRPEGIVGDPVHPCTDGPMLYQYIHDTTGRPNTATYEFILQN